MHSTTFPRLDRFGALCAALFLSLLLAHAALAQGPPCRPCAGVRVQDVGAALNALGAEPRVQGEERLYVQWQTDLDGSADPARFGEILERGGTPWLTVRFQAPAPIFDNLDTLNAELKDLARLAKGAGDRAHFQLLWEPTTGEMTAKEFSFVIKRAAVAVTGSRGDARVLIGPLQADEGFLRALYDEEIAAYVDGLALSPGDGDASLTEAHAAVIAALAELDPGKGVVLDALPWPDPASRALVDAAAGDAAGVTVTFFERPAPSADDLSPLKLLAREFTGDLALDPTTEPTGAERAFTFVRGTDLSLRVIAETLPGEPVQLFFDDAQLKAPRLINLASGERETIFDQRRTTTGLVVGFDAPEPVLLLSIERMSAAELEGIEGLESEVTVSDERQMPVEEILRRLQAFEDAQNRRLDTYQAVNTMNMRFSIGNNVSNAIEVTLRGDFFFRQGQGFDWAWDDLYFNGVKWRRDKFPQLPIIQPEKAAALPLEILFTKEYRYRLRGTEEVEGRDCWVIDFAPINTEPGRVLAQGTVWVDREIYARVKTRAVQVGLEGEDLSNEDTVFFVPIDENGAPAAWSREAYILPLRSTGQQILSILNSVTRVERETELQVTAINAATFEEVREAKLASSVTMVRDTDDGMRYLNVDEETGERVVQKEFDTNHLFLVGGAFYDAGRDFPIPLAGVNYLARKWRGRDIQVNGFFAGPLLIGNIAKPRLGKTKWDLGASVFGFFIGGDEKVYRDGNEVLNEEIESGANGRLNLFVGHPLGDFFKVDLRLGMRWDSFDRADNTAEEFVLPQDTLTQIYETTLQYNRKGYNVTFEGSFNQRQDWEFWGLPGNTDFDPEQEDYIQWRLSASKTWWLKKFQKIGVSADHLNGSDLDRFSKWDFNFFSTSRVAGYQAGLVTADRANVLHLLYGFEIGEAFRVQFQGDTAWVTDTFNGLNNELLAGVSLNGTVIGPWGTIVNFDLGVPVEGPADDFVVFVAFLKLFG